MELAALIDGLSAAGSPRVIQTHISVVFLFRDVVYKLKKPVNLGFLDFGTLDRRRHFCEEEVRLNRRLAPAVYLGVVPVTAGATGLRFEGDGDAVEWAVKMARLPEGASLLDRLARGAVTELLVVKLAERVAEFHARAESGQHIAESARFEAVAANARDNFTQSEAQVGVAIARDEFDRLRERTAAELTRLRPLIESRAARGVPRDTHGDLHLDHVYHFPDRGPPDDLIAIDCIEFADRFRHADPVADAAFLAMDFAFRDRPDLAEVFKSNYVRASGDAEGADLFPLYESYRAAVRAKVEGMELGEAEIPQAERDDAKRRAAAHWRLAATALG
jgi:hypothetical protein